MNKNDSKMSKKEQSFWGYIIFACVIGMTIAVFKAGI